MEAMEKEKLGFVLLSVFEFSISHVPSEAALTIYMLQTLEQLVAELSLICLHM